MRTINRTNTKQIAAIAETCVNATITHISVPDFALETSVAKAWNFFYSIPDTKLIDNQDGTYTIKSESAWFDLKTA